MNDSTKHHEWITTTAFYKAIQLVEALLSQKLGSVSTSHSKRLERLRTKYPALYKQFRPLYNASMVARYLCLPDAHDKKNGKTEYFSEFGSYAKGDALNLFVKGRLVQLEALIDKELEGDFTKTRV
ncbi:MAG: hypothetical protein NXI28_00120 [bacterium]|nr:hypothetical protein [bacterium]